VDSICYKPIGIGHSPFKEPKRVPIQPIFAEKVEGKIGLFHKYTEGLKDLFLDGDVL